MFHPDRRRRQPLALEELPLVSAMQRRGPLTAILGSDGLDGATPPHRRHRVSARRAGPAASSVRWRCSGSRRGRPVRVRLWGTRGSLPTPSRSAVGYGGNTSCVAVQTDDDRLVILDAGTGIAALGAELPGRARPDRHPADPSPHGPHHRPRVLRRLVPSRVSRCTSGARARRRSACGAPAHPIPLARRCSRSGSATSPVT